MTLVLGIETSCDETAAAVVDGERRIRADVVLSQTELQAKALGLMQAAGLSATVSQQIASSTLALAGGASLHDLRTALARALV